MLTNRRLKLLARFFGSYCTTEERQAVQSWIEASERNRNLSEEIRKLWNLAARKKAHWNYRLQIAALRMRLNEPEFHDRSGAGNHLRLYRIAPHHKSHNRLPIPLITQLAASVLLFAGILYLVIYVKKLAVETRRQAPKPAVRYQEISTEPGEQVTLSFPDGSKVYLNYASSLRYSDNWNGSRQVYLKGEAYFVAVHSLYHPFVVHTSYATVEDIGTEFDIRAWPGDSSVRIAVARGKVIIRPKGGSNGDDAVLASGQFTSVDSSGELVSPRYADLKQIIAWTKGRLVFCNDPISDVLTQLERRYNIRCSIADTSIANRTLTATFSKRESAKEVLDIIALSLRMRYTISEDSVAFVPLGKNL